MRLNKLFVTALIFSCLAIQGFSSEYHVRTAFDFGSGAVKVQAALVDPETKCIIGKPILAKYLPLGLTEDVAANEGFISEAASLKAFNILLGFKEEAREAAANAGYFDVEYAGIAAAVFRKAQNGPALLRLFEEQLGIRFHILTQEEEGKLGFQTAKALYPEQFESSILAWDSGNGSFQMTVKEGEHYQIYQGPLGHGTVRVMLSKEIRNGDVLQSNESGNPVLQSEALVLNQKIRNLLPAVPDWLLDILKSEEIHVVTYGDGESIFAITAQALATLDGRKELVQEATLTISDVQRVMDTYVDKEDEIFIEAGLSIKTFTASLQLAAVMQHFGIQQIHFKRSIGNTPGMLILPELWVEQITQG